MNQCLVLPHLTTCLVYESHPPSHLVSSHLPPGLILPHLALPHLIYLISPLTSSHLTSPCLILPLTSDTSSHLASPPTSSLLQQCLAHRLSLKYENYIKQ